MGMEYVCGACGAPIGLNQQSYSLGGYCRGCSLKTQMRYQADAIKNMNPNTAPAEKEVFGETLRDVPLIESDEVKS